MTNLMQFNLQSTTIPTRASKTLKKACSKNLQMPKAYTSIDNEEMEYLSGGATAQKNWWGYYVSFNQTETNKILTVTGGTAAIAAACCSLIPEPAVSKAIGAIFKISGSLIVTKIGVACANGKGFSIHMPWTIFVPGALGSVSRTVCLGLIHSN